MKDRLYKLLQWGRRVIRKFDGFFFSLKLKWIKWHYGSVEAAVEQGEELFHDLTDVDAECLKFASVLQAVCQHYGIDVFETRIGCLYGNLLQSRMECKENEDELMSVILNPHPGLALHSHMQKNGDIPDHKFSYFCHPPAFATMEEWLISLTSTNTSANQ